MPSVKTHIKAEMLVVSEDVSSQEMLLRAV